ncbi:hypothetical protein FPOAC1_003987 [Fusarium poae]|uniref:hypothetical protein n=1 Tax=Fusarium poae TaxID=36050 RepID=UPI001CE986D3|nr:hypothetical protein FPOAC1_003987 [Fusarium poae]KAG8670753.1 hypothetical protein FPOAC1_003987 [Fusarium poae]
MNFDTSVSQVTSWLLDCPIQPQDFDTPALVGRLTATKRRRSSASSCSQPKRRQLLSPPASQTRGVAMRGIATPTKKRLAEGEPSSQLDTDNEDTPRPNIRQTRSGDGSRNSSTSSQSGSSYSRDSKRSRGSASPMKMWPLVGPDGHQLVRPNELAHGAQGAKNLTKAFKQISKWRSFMPKSIQQTLAELEIEDVEDTFSIETKRYGGDIAKGEQQLGLWTAAQWEFLISISGIEAVKELDFIPGVVVNGETWSLVIMTRTGVRTNVHKGIPFGNTGTVAGVFQVLAGLQKLRAWTLDTLWPWYKKHLPGLVDPGNDEIPAVGS